MALLEKLAVTAIDHVTLVVEDLDRSRAFYLGVLGMREVIRPDFGFPGLWFQAGPTQIHLNQSSTEAGTAGLQYNAQSITRALHLAFSVDSVQDAAELLRQQQIEIIAGPRQRPDGAWQLYVMDPDGHQIELTSAQ